MPTVDADSRPATADPADRAGPAVRSVAVVLAVGLVAFAAVNVWFELTGRFEDGPYAAYASGIAVLDWVVSVLKVVGAAVALVSVGVHPGLRPRPAVTTAVSVLVWGGAATFGVYALGSLAELVVWVTGLVRGPDRIGPADVGYVVGTVAFATGFAVLAVDHSRRHGWHRRTVVAGLLAGPLLLALLLLAVPAALAAVGLMPSS